MLSRFSSRAQVMQQFSTQAVAASQLVAQPVRLFGKKKRRSEDAVDSTQEEEPVAQEEPVAEPLREPEPVRAAPKKTMSTGGTATFDEVRRDLFTPFSVGDIKRSDSAPGDKPPSMEDTIEGRYAAVLFMTASQKQALFTVYEDMMYMAELYTHCEQFRMFTENQGVGIKEITKLNEALGQTAEFSDITLHFLTVLSENKRLFYLKDIALKYQKLYQQLNKEEKITIISAEELSDSQRGEVLAALRANPNNEGKQFTIQYEIDASIQGGLQLYTESEFMDMSLASRTEKLHQELNRLVQ
jgi:ATP synthase F1 delta subunit